MSLHPLVLAWCVTLGACAATLQRHLPDHYTVDEVAQCTTEPGLWLLDAVWGGIATVAAAAGFARSSTAERDPGLGWTALGVGSAGAAVGFAVSAIVGEQWTEDCARAKQQPK